MRLALLFSGLAGFFAGLDTLLAAEPGKDAARNEPVKLTILQINDSHAYFDLHPEFFPGPDRPSYRPAGGYARIATLVRQIRAEKGNVLFCDCGDTLYGTYPVQKSQGQALIPVLNALGLDAMTPHWEFVYGPKRFKQLAGQLAYPVLAANIYDQQTGDRPFPSYIVKQVGGLRVGLIGLASNIVDKTMPPSFSEGLRFTPGQEELRQCVDKLRSQDNVDLVVVVSHLGFPQDMRILAEVPGVDVCLSGHTHNRLEQPAIQGETIVIQSGCHGSFVGQLDLEVKNRHVVAYRHRLIEVRAAIPPDPGVEALVKQALAPYQDELDEVVGETATELNRNTILESTMDNLLLQAMTESTGSQLAFSNGWRYGAPIVPGKITLNDLHNMVPLNPPVSTVELKGCELIAMLEENLEHTFAANPLEQMGGYAKRCLGLTVHLKIENPPGYRIQKLFVGDEEVIPDHFYRAAFITEQAVPAKYGKGRIQGTKPVVDVLREYLAKHRPAHAELKGTFVAE